MKRLPRTGDFKDGHKRVGGRKKGVPNKYTREVKEAILEAFDKAGGVKYLVSLAQDKPETFCMLLGKVMPMQVAAKHEFGGELVVRWES